ncbi:MAG: hypothetical protein M0Z30_01935 [Actinomycetota bacterium]|nr:hypothetical protein [Actinomycetota bacterium]
MAEFLSEWTRLGRPRLLATWAVLTAVFAALINTVMFSTVARHRSTPTNGPGVAFPTYSRLQAAGGLTAGLSAAASMFGVLTLAIWATATASDYSTGLVRILVAAQPLRSRLLAGKVAALAILTAAACAVAVMVDTAVAPAAAHAAGISTAAWKSGAAGTIAAGWLNLYLATVVWGLIGLVLAVVTLSSSAAISIGVGWVLLVEGVVKTAVKSVGRWLPGTTLSSLAGSGSAGQPYHRALLLGALYAAVCWVVSWQVFRRREITE